VAGCSLKHIVVFCQRSSEKIYLHIGFSRFDNTFPESPPFRPPHWRWNLHLLQQPTSRDASRSVDRVRLSSSTLRTITATRFSRPISYMRIVKRVTMIMTAWGMLEMNKGLTEVAGIACKKCSVITHAPTTVSKRHTCWNLIRVASAASQLSDSGYTKFSLKQSCFPFAKGTNLPFQFLDFSVDISNGDLCGAFGRSADVPS
jgi:hypothetical protein